MRTAVFLAALALAACGGAAPAAAPAPPPEPPPVKQPTADAPKAARLACADAWLAAKELNAFGDPKDTVYAGGTPLFDEATGLMKDRLAHLLAKHPQLATACP